MSKLNHTEYLIPPNKDTKLTLCVSEAVKDASGSVKNAWKCVSDFLYGNVLRNGDINVIVDTYGKENYFVEHQGSPKYYGDVRLFTLANGKMDPIGFNKAKGVSTSKIIEVVEPRELRNISLENATQVQRVLKSGFSIPNVIRACFQSGRTALAVKLPGETGPKALIIEDCQMVSWEEDNGYSFAKIAKTPVNHKTFMANIPVIDMDAAETIAYKSDETGYTREFVVKHLKYLKPFQPYKPIEFAEMYIRRHLTQAKTNIDLYSGRGLTKADIATIMDSVKASLENEDEFSEHLKVDDPETARAIAEGIKESLGTICSNLLQDDTLHEQIRAFMMESDTIKAACIADAKIEWLKSNDEERLNAEKEIKRLAGEIEQQEATLLIFGKLQEELDALKREETEQRKKNTALQEQLRASLDNYRHNLALLATQMGGVSTNLPLSYIGEKVSVAKTASDTAIRHNLEQYTDAKSAQALSGYIELALAAGLHLAVPGDSAKYLADALSIAADSATAHTIVRADNCSASELSRAVETAPGAVVLVEGVMGCAEDNLTLALARHCKNKVIVFSVDDFYYEDRSSYVLFSKIAMVNPEAPLYAAKEQTFEVHKNPSRIALSGKPSPLQVTGNEDIDRLINEQKARQTR